MLYIHAVYNIETVSKNTRLLENNIYINFIRWSNLWNLELWFITHTHTHTHTHIYIYIYIYIYSVMVSKLDLQTYTSEFESHWVPHSYGFVPHLSKKLCKLPYIYIYIYITTHTHTYIYIYLYLYIYIQHSWKKSRIRQLHLCIVVWSLPPKSVLDMAQTIWWWGSTLAFWGMLSNHSFSLLPGLL